MRKIPHFFGLLIVLSLLVGCQSNSSTDNNNTDTLVTTQTDDDVSEYPVQETKDITDVYPVPSLADEPILDGYPPVVVQDESLRFTIEEPVFEGGTEISGIGIARTPIRIVSISNVGETLGLGVTEEDGSFDITLSRPLNTKETIAIMLQDGVSQADFVNVPDATDIPMIGFILDMAIATAP